MLFALSSILALWIGIVTSSGDIEALRIFYGMAGVLTVAVGLLVAVDGFILRSPKEVEEAEQILPASQSFVGFLDSPILDRMKFRVVYDDNFIRRERVFDAKDEPFVEKEVLIIEEGVVVVHASVFDIHSQCAWKSGSPDEFVHEDDSPCDLRAVLSGPKYQERLAPAKHVVFVGLESFPNSPIEMDCHGTLSHCRYIQLAGETHKVRPDDWSLRRYWGLDIGKASRDDPDHEFDQRRALVLGIRDCRQDYSLEEAISKLVMTTSINDVDLRFYDKAFTARPSGLGLGDPLSGPAHIVSGCTEPER